MVQKCVVVCVILLVTSCFGKPGQWKHGGGEEHYGEEFSSHGEKGDKGYLSKHGVESGSKGHHDKENHSGHYDESDGKKSSHHHDDGYSSSHESGEKASKGSHFQEEGSFKKGHSTKGSHSIHKLDEFKKNTEFSNEDKDEAYKEKHSGYNKKFGFAKGGHEAAGHFNKIYLEGEFGKEGDFEKGAYFDENSGYKGASGLDSYYGNGEKFESNAGNEAFKKWGHESH